MTGRESPPQASLFYTGINLDKRVRSDHVLRKVARLVDFDFVYGEVKVINRVRLAPITPQRSPTYHHLHCFSDCATVSTVSWRLPPRL